MKRHAMATCLLMAALGVCAQTQEQDSLRVINLQEVEVISTRATNSTPVAFTNIGKEQLKKQNFGQDIVKKVKRNIRKNELKSASEVLTIYDKELTDDIIDALKEKKKQVLEEVKLDKSKTAEGFTTDKSTPAPSTNYNPFK